MNLRKITSMTMFLSLFVLFVNSIVLYVVPEGRVAYWAEWSFLGLSKTHWGEQHTTIGFLFLGAGMLHIYYNWKVIVAYMKNKLRQVRVFTGAFNVALVLTIIFIVGTYFHIPPMSTIVAISDSFKEAASEKYGEPPYGHAESSSLKMFTKRESLGLEKSMALLKAEGIEVTSEKESIKAIANKSSRSPQEIYLIIKPTGRNKQELGTQGTIASVFPDEPKPGWGKKKIIEICTEYNLNPDLLMGELAKRGIAVEIQDTVKNVATKNDIEPINVFEAIHDIVNKDGK